MRNVHKNPWVNANNEEVETSVPTSSPCATQTQADCLRAGESKGTFGNAQTRLGWPGTLD
jgi:hypothetical protein